VYYDVLIAIVSCHGLRPPYHFVCYLTIKQQDWRRPLSLVVFDCILVILARDSWVNRLVYILREKSGDTEVLIGY